MDWLEDLIDDIRDFLEEFWEKFIELLMVVWSGIGAILMILCSCTITILCVGASILLIMRIFGIDAEWLESIINVFRNIGK